MVKTFTQLFIVIVAVINFLAKINYFRTTTNFVIMEIKNYFVIKDLLKVIIIILFNLEIFNFD